MLCQLVCVDRRYARMNCFNIRELQGILKRRFFTDLINSSDHRDVLDSSMIGLRFKTNNNLNLNHDLLSFYNFGTTTGLKNRHYNIYNIYDTNPVTVPLLKYFIQHDFSLNLFINSLFNYISFCIHSVYFFFINLSPLNLLPVNILSSLTQAIVLNFNISAPLSNVTVLTKESTHNAVLYTTTSTIVDNKVSMYSNLESSYDIRYNRFSNPVVSYDFKCGHYLGIWDKLFPSLMVSFIEQARGMRKAS